MKKIFLLISACLCLEKNISAQSHWTQCTTSIGVISAVAAIGDTILASSTSSGIYFSTDSGITWARRDTNTTRIVRTLITSGNDIYAGSGGGLSGIVAIYKSSDFGWTWTDVSPAGMVSGSYVKTLAVNSTDIFAGLSGATGTTGVVKSPLSGISTSSWANFSNGLTSQAIYSLQISGTNIYAGSYGKGVFISPTANANWTSTSGMQINSEFISSISVNGSDVYAGNASGYPALYHSTNGGANWAQSSTFSFLNKQVGSVITDGTNIFAGTDGIGVMLSTNSGQNWFQWNTGFLDNAGNWYCNGITVYSMLIKGTTMYAATDCGVWKRSTSTSCFASVSDSIYKDPSQPLTWDIIPNYSPQVTSAEWFWGDGTSTTGLYPSHTYATTGWYTISTKAYASCGDSSSFITSDSIYRVSGSNAMITANVIQNPTVVNQISATNNHVSVFPNPGKGSVTI
ncbi:MAG TPA: hypothetical protein VNX68_10820, partial [Nitrosopumilaceae archaeon]|nr:hypothetical protein [Nitrosopumilaceae archaeon]